MTDQTGGTGSQPDKTADRPDELPTADWYTDPDDSSQYRYWDGTAWTDHRAPRFETPSAHAAGDGLRRPGELLGEAAQLLRRHWRSCALAASALLVGQVAWAVLSWNAYDDMLEGQLAEILERVTAPGFDPEDAGWEAYVETLSFKPSASGVALAVIAVLALWIPAKAVNAFAARLFVDDLEGRDTTAVEALRLSVGRILRMMGLDLQIVALALGVPAVVMLAFLASPTAGLLILLILLILASIATAIVAAAVIAAALVTAAVGPAEWSLRYGARLVRPRFRAALGRMLLVFLTVVGVSIAVGVVFGALGTVGPGLWWLSQIVNTMVGAVLTVYVVAAAVVLYFDLGGKSD